MFEEFLSKFHVTQEISQDTSIRFENPDLQIVISELGGKVFNNGLYRVFPAEQIEMRTRELLMQFPRAKEIAIVFGCDWEGRYFTTSLDDMIDGHATTMLVSFDTNEVFCIDRTLIDFHNLELTGNPDASLDYPLYQEWRKTDSEPIDMNECIGFKVPLCLGGQDTVENLGRTDLSVCRDLTAQIWVAIHDLPEGASVDQFRIE